MMSAETIEDHVDEPKEMILAFDYYQHLTRSTAKYPADVAIVYTAMGLVGEAGEVCNKLKKVLRDEGGNLTNDRRQQLKYELGDVLWYLARFAAEIGFDLSEIATDNIAKLRDRMERGMIQGSGDAR
jgi:NTP pyrophosphatase (non-canonical NTP hydrolase)